jgi:hypothetical protein
MSPESARFAEPRPWFTKAARELPVRIDFAARAFLRGSRPPEVE